MDISLLLVAPPQAWREELRAFLSRNGLDVQVANGIDALGRSDPSFRSSTRMSTPSTTPTMPTPALVLLCGGPGTASGGALLSLLRKRGCDAPVIMLGSKPTGAPVASALSTEISDEAMEKIICLELGAEDYLDMPCNHRELLSRIRNVLRHRPPRMPTLADRNERCAFGDFVLDLSQRTLTRRGLAVTIQGTSLALLQRLVTHPMEVLSRQSLIAMLYGDNAETGGTYSATCERSLDVVVCRLRRIIEADPSRPKFIQTVRGFGYVFNPLDASDTDTRLPAAAKTSIATVLPTIPMGRQPGGRFNERSFPTQYRGFAAP